MLGGNFSPEAIAAIRQQGIAYQNVLKVPPGEYGRFYTNLEETGQTVAIDVKKRAIVSSWHSCDHPSGVAVDSKRQFVFVACVDHVIVLDGGHNGAQLGSLDTGEGWTTSIIPRKPGFSMPVRLSMPSRPSLGSMIRASPPQRRWFPPSKEGGVSWRVRKALSI